MFIDKKHFMHAVPISTELAISLGIPTIVCAPAAVDGQYHMGRRTTGTVSTFTYGTVDAAPSGEHLRLGGNRP